MPGTGRGKSVFPLASRECPCGEFRDDCEVSRLEVLRAHFKTLSPGITDPDRLTGEGGEGRRANRALTQERCPEMWAVASSSAVIQVVRA